MWRKHCELVLYWHYNTMMTTWRCCCLQTCLSLYIQTYIHRSRFPNTCSLYYYGCHVPAFAYCNLRFEINLPDISVLYICWQTIWGGCYHIQSQKVDFWFRRKCFFRFYCKTVLLLFTQSACLSQWSAFFHHHKPLWYIESALNVRTEWGRGRVREEHFCCKSQIVAYWKKNEAPPVF